MFRFCHHVTSYDNSSQFDVLYYFSVLVVVSAKYV